MKILAIQGSPRETGLTTKMLKYASARCKTLGHDVTYVNLHSLNLSLCKGCRKCFENGGCIFRHDDIEKIELLIKEADVIILATPTYWANVPAVVKNLFDRLTGASMKETGKFPKPLLNGKKYILLTACATPMPFAYLAGQIPGLKRAVNEYFKTSGIKCIGTVVCCKTDIEKSVPIRKLQKLDKILLLRISSNNV